MIVLITLYSILCGFIAGSLFSGAFSVSSYRWLDITIGVVVLLIGMTSGFWIPALFS